MYILYIHQSVLVTLLLTCSKVRTREWSNNQMYVFIVILLRSWLDTSQNKTCFLLTEFPSCSFANPLIVLDSVETDFENVHRCIRRYKMKLFVFLSQWEECICHDILFTSLRLRTVDHSSCISRIVRQRKADVIIPNVWNYYIMIYMIILFSLIIQNKRKKVVWAK